MTNIPSENGICCFNDIITCVFKGPDIDCRKSTRLLQMSYFIGLGGSSMGQAYDCPSASEIPLTKICEWIMDAPRATLHPIENKVHKKPMPCDLVMWGDMWGDMKLKPRARGHSRMIITSPLSAKTMAVDDISTQSSIYHWNTSRGVPCFSSAQPYSCIGCSYVFSTVSGCHLVRVLLRLTLILALINNYIH